MPELTTLHLTFPLALLLLFVSTVAFDAVHVTLHILSKSENSLLKRIGALHDVHHAFLDRDLRIHEDKILANVLCHVVPEYIVQVVITVAIGLSLTLLFKASGYSGLIQDAVLIAISLETLVFLLIMKPTPGFDVNHRYVDQLLPYRPLYFCMPEYHLLHHVYPDAYFGSWLKTLDHLLCTGISLKGRRVAIAGTDTGAGKYLYENLFDAGCEIKTLDINQSDDLNEQLLETDVLVLADNKIDSSDYCSIIESYHSLYKDSRIPVEVWVITAFDKRNSPAGKNFDSYARKLFKGEKVIYRHLVCSAEPEKKSMRKLFKRIQRGWNYVPDQFSFPVLIYGLKFIF